MMKLQKCDEHLFNPSMASLRPLLNPNHISTWSNLMAINIRLPNLPHHSHFIPLPSSLSSSHRFPFRSSFSSMITAQADPHDLQSSSASTKTVRVVISGRVHGVFYRKWTIENASQLDLKGWVRNRKDGTVEALFSGNSDSVNEMERRCRIGPPAALVTKLDVLPCNDDPGTGFEGKQTL